MTFDVGLSFMDAMKFQRLGTSSVGCLWMTLKRVAVKFFCIFESAVRNGMVRNSLKIKHLNISPFSPKFLSAHDLGVQIDFFLKPTTQINSAVVKAHVMLDFVSQLLRSGENAPEHSVKV